MELFFVYGFFILMNFTSVLIASDAHAQATDSKPQPLRQTIQLPQRRSALFGDR